MNATKKDVLLDMMAACHDDPSWYPTFRQSIDGLSAEEATWKANDSSHSIWQLVNHLTYWNERWMRRFTGEEIFKSIGKNNDMTFEITIDTSEENWQSAVKRLDATYTQWRSAIVECPESKLDANIPDYPEGCPWWAGLSNLCTHNTYHIGQIIFIRKQQGSWEG
ncbi:DinB family protein [Camelliibacillus cellulosilyticus]|uniref:DinB family protein n=1 Tax=Camelliibacillus cellulosilyticus TaxID=2174486 RepID=A0ABV9GSE3_9BACL